VAKVRLAKGVAMISVPVKRSQANQVEYLIEQSMKGHHVLFETAELRRVFLRKRESEGRVLSDQEAYAIEPIIERLIQEPSLEAKRAFLDGLDRRTFDTVVRTYFCIVENNMFEKLEVHH
jgi:hypothetical protein